MVGEKRGWGRGEGGGGRYFGGRPKFWKCGGKLCARCRRTIHFERLCASQTILLLYAHGMSLIIQILVSRHGHIHIERARCRRTIHFERLCASQTILLLYAHGMSLIIQILVEISPGTSLHNLTSLANLGTQKSVQHTDHTY